MLGVAPDALALALGPVLLLLALTGKTLGRDATARRLAVIAVGVLAVALRSVIAGEPPAAPAAIPPGDGPWVGVVQTVGAPREGSRPTTMLLEVDEAAPIRVAATLPWFPAVVPGDRLSISGRIRPPPESEYGEYLAKIGAIGTLQARSLELLPADGTAERALEGLRRSAATGIDRSMPEPEAGLAAGVLIGLRDRVDRDLADAFTIAGASHVVAISGWNIAIVASTLGALAGGLQRRRRAILTAAAIVVYVAFVGPSASVVRAGVMAGVALLARELGRPGTAAAALGWAITGLLLIDPDYAFDAGFRLSVLATAGIIAWGSGLTERLAGAAPSRPRRWVAEILGVSFAAQIATTPVVLFMFGRLSLVAPVVNLIVVPLVPPAMATGALALVVGMAVDAGVPPGIATLVGLPAWLLYATMVGVVRLGAGLPLASLELLPPWDGVAALVSLGLIVAVARWGDLWLAQWRSRGTRAAALPAAGRTAAAAGAGRRRERGSGGRPSRSSRVALAAVAAATIGLALAFVYRPDGLAKVVVLDVGQGDGILVEGGRGGRMVVDGGPDPGRLLIALDERLPPWDRRIDVLVLTHPHEDHVAGLALLLERYSIGRVYEPGMLGAGPGYRAWTTVLAKAGTPHGRLSTGDRLTIDQVSLRVLWPDPNRVPERPPDGGTSVNNVSIVLLGEVGAQRFLLAGDIEEGVDPELLARGLPTVDLLKVAHHGSRTASTGEFLAAVRPGVAVVSAGAGNSYGHPAPATLERLAAVARETYRTDTDGTVEVTFTGQGVRIKKGGARPPPKLRPTQSATEASAAGVSAAGPSAAGLLCGIPGVPQLGPPDGARRIARPPTAPEAPGPPRIALGAMATARAGAGLPTLGRLPADGNGAASALAYHRPDGDSPGLRDRTVARDRSPRLLLGRRRVRPGGRGRRFPEGSEPLPGWRSGALATRGGLARSRPPPR
jgi:competence protein ComEC